MAYVAAFAGGLDLAEYLAYMVGHGYCRGTIRSRLSVARDFARGTQIRTATWRDVERWAAGRGVSAASQRNLLVNLRAFYRWARRNGIADADPTELADRPAIPHRLPRPAPEREIARLVAGANVPLRALVALMSCAGLRCVECSRLDWVDVDLGAATVIVNGKGSRERLIDLSPDVVRALAELALSVSGRHTGPVFVGPYGRRLSPARVSQVVARAARAAGVDVRAHRLRHRCATMALQQSGADLLAVRDLLGHASVATTQIYTAVIPGRTAATSRALRLPAA
jgi:site-specific recombinase XerD